MKIGFVQFNPIFGKKQENYAAVERLLHSIEADVIVVPELFNTGYAFLNKEELAALSEPMQGETSEFMQKLAKKYNCALAYGFAERAADPGLRIRVGSFEIGPRLENKIGKELIDHIFRMLEKGCIVEQISNSEHFSFARIAAALNLLINLLECIY